MSKNIGPHWTFQSQLQPSTPKRRLNQDERHHLCAVCNEAFVVSTDDPFPSTTCNNPCKDPIELVRDAKNDCAFDFQSTNDGCGYDLALRILKRVKERAA